MKELPYFKFDCSEWMTGDITFEDFATQGLFINICAYYWKQDCSVTIAKLRQRYSRAKGSHFDKLFENNIIKKDEYNNARINFLDEQFQERKTDFESRSARGRLGAEKRWQKHSTTIALPKLANGKSMQDKDKIKIRKDKDNINNEFSFFWMQYHSITGKEKTDKEPAFKHWKKLTADERKLAIKNIKPFYDSLPNKEYCKKARTYLSDKNFNDEFNQEQWSGPNELAI